MSRAKVTGVFLSSDRVWGKPETGAWHHLAVTPADLFPTILKAESHAVRSVIEAYSKAATMQGADQASAACVMPHKGCDWNVLVRATSGGEALEDRQPRWD